MTTVATTETRGLRRRLITALLIIGVSATVLALLHYARQPKVDDRPVGVEPR
ncbi:MAG TPA: hypothetical protein VNN80_23555 [Polyangiaceae bacterium]|jgi:hypothetical protein|nr:hypothetical protein [Polyangiaceae bacterium]